ncbi:MAG: cupredoxin domain-containing protein [Firmicutes bacterium]|nr:cupredoxin domain-containing protein [Bacillota bacterium]
MRIRLLVVVAALLAAVLASVPAQQPEPAPAQEIEVTAKKYEFQPSEIRVRQGTRVQLRVRALDRTHGIEFRLDPEGGPEKGSVGLRFPDEQRKWKLEPNQEQVIEFTAERPGAYEFRCAVYCGLGHRRMKGTLIVEP